MNNTEFHSLWRASANEAVMYSNDYPEALLVLPELIDGALGDGKASEISIEIDMNGEKSVLRVKDNGVGIVNERRLQDWAAKHSSLKSEHIYGHGSKKCLTKWMPDYETAEWKIKWRKQDKRGLSGALHILSSPFLGLDTEHQQDDIDEKTCEISGTEWEIHFDLNILNNESAVGLMKNLREIICTRYEKSLYHPFEIKITISHAHGHIKESSNTWKTLKETLDDEIKKKTVTKYYDFIDCVDDTQFTCQIYKITTDGRGFKLDGFPLYGVKNMKASRIHIANKNRYIEALPYANFLGKEIHNSDNGTIGFVNFIEGPLPTPCTTKVKFQEECPIYKKCIAKIKNRLRWCHESGCEENIAKMGDYCTKHQPIKQVKPKPDPIVVCREPKCQTRVEKLGDYCTKHQSKPDPIVVCREPKCQTRVEKLGDYCTKHQSKPDPIVVCREPKCQTRVEKLGDYCTKHQQPKLDLIVVCREPKCQTRVEKLGDYCTKHHEEQVGQLKNYVGEHGLDVVLDILKKHFMLH